MGRRPPDYVSYLLRLWVAHERGRPVWRASLQGPHTGERVSFRTLDELFAFVRRQADTALAPQNDGADSEGQQS